MYTHGMLGLGLFPHDELGLGYNVYTWHARARAIPT